VASATLSTDAAQRLISKPTSRVTTVAPSDRRTRIACLPGAVAAVSGLVIFHASPLAYSTASPGDSNSAAPPERIEKVSVTGTFPKATGSAAAGSGGKNASDTATRLPIREIVDIFFNARPHWTFRTIIGAGHMAPLTRPELINPIIREFLGAHRG